MDPEALTGELLAKLKKDREREVLSKRFSLNGDRRETLEEIGQSYQITRERVRQIEKSALSRLRKEIGHLDHFEQLARTALNETGGIATSDTMLKRLTGSIDPRKSSALLFLMHIDPAFEIVEEDSQFEESWILSEVTEQKLNSITQSLIDGLAAVGKPVELSKIVSDLANNPDYASVAAVHPNFLSALISCSKVVMKTDAGLYGLASWREINPRSIKDKTYYVLKKVGHPMHFAEISEAISKLGFDHRRVTKQAVHNELIRDTRFVLIGRGIYALAEWGYRPGTVSDVIVDILKKAGRALHKNEIVAEVLKLRQVKETTIVLNLQNKNLFRRVAKATYTLVTP